VALLAAGALAIAVAVVHATVLERSVFPKAQIEPRRTRALLHAVCQLSTIDWIAVGVLVMAAPGLGAQTARDGIVAVAVVMYGCAAAANAVVSRGRHPGWMLMTCVVVLAVLGL
jgi:hypothetical protein